MSGPVVLDALATAIRMIERITDRRERIRAIRALRDGLARDDDRLKVLLRDAILDLRAADPPATWQSIADELGVHAVRAMQLAKPTKGRHHP